MIDRYDIYYKEYEKGITGEWCKYDDVKKLEKKYNELKNDTLYAYDVKRFEKVKKLEKENKKYKECLQWYANKNHIDMPRKEVGSNNFHVTGCYDCYTEYFENGQKARDCLKDKTK